MGFGGQVTLLGCKIGVMNRLPASFFVSVAYNCWAFRRQGVVLDRDNGRDPGVAVSRTKRCRWKLRRRQTTAAAAAPDETPRGRADTPPITEEQIRQLRVGDVVIINGLMHTGRDALHKYLIDHDSPVDLNGARHLPLRSGHAEGRGRASGTSRRPGRRPASARSRIRRTSSSKFGIRAVIGKGGMGAEDAGGAERARRRLSECHRRRGAILRRVHQEGGRRPLHGSSAFRKRCGICRWKGFAAIVTMDAHGNSLHADVEKSSLEKLAQFKDPCLRLTTRAKAFRPERLRKTPRGGGAIPRRPEALPSAAAFSLFGRELRRLLFSRNGWRKNRFPEFPAKIYKQGPIPQSAAVKKNLLAKNARPLKPHVPNPRLYLLKRGFSR